MAPTAEYAIDARPDMPSMSSDQSSLCGLNRAIDLRESHSTPFEAEVQNESRYPASPYVALLRVAAASCVGIDTCTNC